MLSMRSKVKLCFSISHTTHFDIQFHVSICCDTTPNLSNIDQNDHLSRANSELILCVKIYIDCSKRLFAFESD